MKINKLKIFVGIIVIIIVAFAFKPKPENKVYSYLTIQSIHADLDDVFISIGGKEYKKIHLVKQVQGAFDLNPLINLINQYENEGWEMQYFYGPSTQCFVVMRKEK